MIADEFEGGRDPSAPIDMLEDYFSAHGWTSERAGDDEIVTTVTGSWTQYELRAVWREDDRVLQFLGFPDIRVSADKRAAIYEVLGLINEQLWLGHFDLWSSESVVMYRHALLLSGGAEPTEEQAIALVKAAVEACERYYQAFQFVVWAGKTAKEGMEGAILETVGEA